jgi:DMSO/TMAO reductase YedYZ molybdopterin-dependent catalytic subunit
MFQGQRHRREREAQVRAQNRLPPGQSLTEKFPVLHYGPTPRYRPDLSDWDFRMFGLVEEEQRWDWAAFQQLRRTQVTMDIHCVTRWSKFDTLWEGISLKSLVDAGIVVPRPEARYVVQHCENGFTTNLPLAVMLQDNVLLATHYDGQPLAPDHGYPLRVIIGTFAQRDEGPSAYFWKGGKWLRGLEFRAEDQPGFWERAGYHNEADPWLEQRYSRPGY